MRALVISSAQLIMPSVRDPEIKELIKLIEEGVVGLDADFGYQQVCDLCPGIRKACAVSLDASVYCNRN